MRNSFRSLVLVSCLFAPEAQAQAQTYPQPPLTDCSAACSDPGCLGCVASGSPSCPTCATSPPFRVDCCEAAPNQACGCFATGVDCNDLVTDVVEHCIGSVVEVREEFERICEHVSISKNSCGCTGGSTGDGIGCWESPTICGGGTSGTYFQAMSSVCGSTGEAVCSEDAVLTCEPRDEICGNGADDDGDGATDETTTAGNCTDEQPCNLKDDDGDGLVDEDSTTAECCSCGRCEGKPVDLFSKQMYVGPHAVAHVASDLGGSADLDFALVYDSKRAKSGYDDDTSGPGGVNPRRQQPFLRDSGPGFRHTFSDRLVFAKGTVAAPIVMRWESATGAVRFYKTATAGTYTSEPGTNHRLRRNGTVWRLHTDGGDVLEFNEMSGTGTWLHPWDATLGFHARLSAIFPGGAAMRKTVLLYEDSAQGSAPTQLPAAACTGLATANAGEPAPTNGGCDPSRGLLVKVGIVLDGTLHGESLELQYRFVDDAGQRDQYLIKAVRSGADRINLTAISTLAELNYLGTSGVTPKRLEKVRNMLYCTSSNDSCLRWKYAYTNGSWPWAITDVERVAVDGAGTLTTIDDEDFTWDSTNPVVTAHKSRGVSLSSSTAAGTSTMNWVRNGESETSRFDFEGRPIQCSAGTCGDPSSEKRYQLSSTVGTRQRV